MIEVEKIRELVRDESVKGTDFLNWLVDQLKKEKMVPEEKAVYLEAIHEASDFTQGNLKSPKEEDDHQVFIERFIQFIKGESMTCVATPQGRTALHWMHGFDGAYLVANLSQKEIEAAYLVKDKKNQDIFAGKDGVECGALLDMLEPAHRVDFLLKNMRILRPMHVDDLVDILSGMNVGQMDQLLSHAEEGHKSLWNSYMPHEKQRLLKGIYRSYHIRWEGPVKKQGGFGFSDLSRN